jgi:uncharacterized glyoxalase superfamily protein PhnB
MPDQQKATETSLDTVIVFTSRMKALAAFYSQGLGIGPYQESPKHLGCRIGSVYFGFDQVDAESDKGPKGFGPTIWFTVEDIEDSFRRLVELGATVRYPPTKKPWGAKLASLEDLDGNIFGISQRLESTDE